VCKGSEFQVDGAETEKAVGYWCPDGLARSFWVRRT